MEQFQESVNNTMSNSKELVHSLYNSISSSNKTGFEDIKEVLLKVYVKLDSNENNNAPLLNRLINYLYFTGYTNNLKFSFEENELIRQISDIAKYAGINGVYRSDYGDKSQF